jgi:transcriptional regulator with XRE-family HTH domain
MNTTLGITIKQARLEKGLKLRDVSKVLGISTGYLSNLENDRSPTLPSEDLVKRIASFYRIDETKLLVLADILSNNSKTLVKTFVYENGEKELEEALTAYSSYRKRK